MFSLIALGVGAAYLYSLVATVAPWVFPERFRAVVDGAVGAHKCCEKFFGFPGPCVAAADAYFLAQRHRRDVEPRIAPELDHRVGVGIVHPPRAAIERHVERRGIGQAARRNVVPERKEVKIRAGLGERPGRLLALLAVRAAEPSRTATPAWRTSTILRRHQTRFQSREQPRRLHETATEMRVREADPARALRMKGRLGALLRPL